MSSDDDDDRDIGNEMDDDEMEIDMEIDSERRTQNFSHNPIKVLTENDVVGYLKERIRLAELNEIYWCPLMLTIFKKYPNLSDAMVGTVELMLNIPIQLNVLFETYEIDLNDIEVIIPFEGRVFVKAKQFVNLILREKLISLSDIRERALHLFIENREALLTSS